MTEFNVDLDTTVNGIVNWPVLLLGLGVILTIEITTYNRFS